MNPFEEKPQKIEKSFQSWKNVLVKPYDKQTVDPYTRLRVILMNGTEFESVRLGHSYTRNCTNNDIRRELAHTVNLRNTPEIRFILDQSIEYGVHMSKIIDEVTAKDDENV